MEKATRQVKIEAFWRKITLDMPGNQSKLCKLCMNVKTFFFPTGLAFILTVLPPLADAATLTTLYNFTEGGTSTSGGNPEGALHLGPNGYYYGTTHTGGVKSAGTVFKFDAVTKALTVLHAFDDYATGTGIPYHAQSGLTPGSDGNYYGTTGYDAGGNGAFYKITPAGVYTKLYSFIASSSGSAPAGELVFDGSAFYGNTYSAGPIGSGATGTVFKLSPAGVETTLYGFGRLDPSPPDSNIHGAAPNDGLIRGNDGNFYGTTTTGGAYGYGVAFVVSSTKALTVLHDFGGTNDGQEPDAGLAPGTDGNFYGTTVSGGGTRPGGNPSYGTIFKMTPAGVVTILRQLALEEADYPEARFLLGSDGNFYGTSSRGGPSGYGTIFSITPSGVYTLLHTFTHDDGSYPVAALIEGKDGNLYGTTECGGSSSTSTANTNGYGTIFKLTTNLPH